ncbi:MAG: hypothetical protein ACYTGP_04180 [Planctomycetota bacterium]|jgi:hypothetical protein
MTRQRITARARPPFILLACAAIAMLTALDGCKFMETTPQSPYEMGGGVPVSTSVVPGSPTTVGPNTTTEIKVHLGFGEWSDSESKDFEIRCDPTGYFTEDVVTGSAKGVEYVQRFTRTPEAGKAEVRFWARVTNKERGPSGTTQAKVTTK